MIITACLNNGVHTARSALDTEKDLDIGEGQWEKMEDCCKRRIITDYWDSEGYPEIYWEE